MLNKSEDINIWCSSFPKTGNIPGRYNKSKQTNTHIYNIQIHVYTTYKYTDVQYVQQ